MAGDKAAVSRQKYHRGFCIWKRAAIFAVQRSAPATPTAVIPTRIRIRCQRLIERMEPGMVLLLCCSTTHVALS